MTRFFSFLMLCLLVCFGLTGQGYAQPQEGVSRVAMPYQANPVGAVSPFVLIHDEADVELPSTTVLDLVLVDAESNVVKVSWRVISFPLDPVDPIITREYRGQFSLDSDRFIQSKMSMLMLLREALTDDSVIVRVEIKPETLGLDTKTISSISLAPRR